MKSDQKRQVWAVGRSVTDEPHRPRWLVYLLLLIASALVLGSVIVGGWRLFSGLI